MHLGTSCDAWQSTHVMTKEDGKMLNLLKDQIGIAYCCMPSTAIPQMTNIQVNTSNDFQIHNLTLILPLFPLTLNHPLV
jgi:hypothetical protein